MLDGSDRPSEKTDDAGPSRNGWDLIDLSILRDPPRGLAAAVYALGGLFAFAVVVLVGFGLFAAFQIAYETAIGRFSDRIEAAKVFFPILVALVGGPLLIWRVITAHVQAQAARNQADTGREAHYTSLFTKAVEQLGATRDETNPEGQTKTNPNLEVRLGAIYALERIAQDSERDHWPIMEVLSAYVRNHQNTGAPVSQPKDVEELNGWLGQLPEGRVDVRAAITVIGRRNQDRILYERRNNFRLDFSHANLQNASLMSGSFEFAIFAKAFLESATLSENNFTGASFYQAHLEGAYLERASLQRALLSGVNLNMASMNMADLTDAILNDAVLIRARLDEANLSGVSVMHADLTDARLRDVVAERAVFFFAKMDGAELFGADLSSSLHLSDKQLASTFGDTTTKLPEGLQRPKDWPDHELGSRERRRWKEKEQEASL